MKYLRPLSPLAIASLALLSALPAKAASEAEGSRPPNVLFIALDDLNDWIGCLGGHPQTLTPNLDRLAAGGALFTNAHCPGSACNPSRSAIMTGLSPHVSGLYANGQKMREILPDADLIPQHFRNHGYRAMGSGKMLHYFIDARSWDEYYPEKGGENPFPRTLYPEKRPVSLPRGGPWQYVETDWAALDATDEEFGGDWLVSQWVGEQLAREHEQPFFLACGIYRPHEPWFVPSRYFEPFPLEEIQLPPGYKEDDLDDLPPAGKKRGPNRYFDHIRKHGQWKQGIQGYLASIHFADAMLGRVLDALESGPNRDHTIVVLWSDHGWHLGEKQHWQKFTGWRAVSRVPLIVRIPEGAAPGLPKGTKAGDVCDRPVNLLSLFPTLTELAGLPAKEDNSGPSLVPLLEDSANRDWDHVSITHLHEPGSFGLSADDWRYLRYANGDEELYHIAEDPFEWHNLAGDSAHTAALERLRERAPKTFAPLLEAKLESWPSLTWKPAAGEATPPSRPDGSPFDVIFINRRTVPIELFWMTRHGKRKTYGGIEPGGKKRQQTRPGAVWQIADPVSGKPLGYFKVGDRAAKAIVPKQGKRIASVEAVAKERTVTAPPSSLGLDPFYRKYTAVGPYPIVSSEKASDFALLEAAYLIEQLLAKRPDILAALGETGSRFTVMAHDEYTTDIPEHADVPGGSSHSADWWDRRARGLGGSATMSVASCGEENLLCFPGDPYEEENLLIHEFAHTIHLRGLNHLDPGFDDQLKGIYDRAMAAGRWEGTYASGNHHEYFAEGVQSWFNNNREPDHDHNHVNTRAELREHDPDLASLLEQIFGDTEFEYVRPTDRKELAHLEGYDFANRPTFRWPKRLRLIETSSQ